MHDNWKRGYYVATYILAFIAVFGSIISIIMSRSTSKVMKGMQQELATSNIMSQSISKVMKGMQQELATSNAPLVKIDGYGWVKDGTEISPENPPSGVYVSCYNVSRVPIQIHEMDIKFFYGKKAFPDAVAEIGEASSRIVSPGQHFKHIVKQKEFLQKHLRGKTNIAAPPFIRVEARIIFSSFNSTERYIYETTQEIGFDCSNYEATQRYTLTEEVSRLTD